MSEVNRGLVRAPKAAQWVQTDRATHEAWAQLSLRTPRAAAVMHLICSQMLEGSEAVIVSWSTLSELSGLSVSTIRRAVSELAAGDWVQVVRVGKGGCNAIVVNSRVGWTKPRDKIHFARFGATVIASSTEQEDQDLLQDNRPLKKLPMMRGREQQLPAGPGEFPPSQPGLDGLDLLDLPAPGRMPE